MSATTLPAHTDPMVDFQATHEPHDAQPDDHQSHSASIELNSSYMNHSFNLNNSFAICDPIDLVWQDVTVKAGQTVLLNNVSGHISEGLISIMGPSGSGKTTLLNCLACRLDANVTVEGSLRINGEPYTTSTLKKFLGYVMQDDVHNPLLTPRETLRFVAEARLRHKMSDAECHKMVDDALHTLSLTHCADTLIGQGNSGISGGEKKRLSVAIELLSQPKMLFLDEPTSNLDSLDALHFIEAMRNLVTETHCVIVCTIHQPQFKVFSLFERLLMLRSGETVYDGPISDVSQFCSDAGKPCPPLANPADHMMDVIAPVTNDSFDTEKRKREEFAALYGHRNVNLDTGIGRNNLTYLREGAPFVGMLRMSFHRSLVLISRRRNEFIINFFITAINAVLIGLVFFRVGTGSASNNVRLPALFFAVVNQATFGAVSTVNLIPNERSSILRDRASGHVSALSFFIGKVSAEMLSKLPFPIIFSIISYFLIGFQEEGNHFFRFLAILCMANWTGIAVALAASAIAKDAHTAALALPLFMELSRLFGGYFIPLAQLPAGLRWINYGSYLFYAFNGVSQNEFSDLVLDCAPTCSDGYGINVLNTRGQYLSYADSMGILTCYWAICLVAAYLAVRFRK